MMDLNSNSIHDAAASNEAPSHGEACASTKRPRSKVYQATVEDDIDSSVEEKGFSNGNTQSQPFGDQAPRKQASMPNTSRPAGQAANSPPRTDPTSKEASATKRPSRIRHENLHVHFSNRQPPQTYSNPKTSNSSTNNKDSSDRNNGVDDSRPRQNSSRPRVSKEGSQGRERSKLSAVDLRWGLLFSEDGMPTERLEQFLGGIADHLISEYEPKDSMVISPRKLLAFYKTFACKDELIPFSLMFRCHSTSELKALRSIYRALRCDVHLVSESPGEVPDVPALTPAGFVRWMTCCILAAPDQEALRLCRVVESLPIDLSSSSHSERLPKQLSRHLLPAKPDPITREWLMRVCDAEGLPTTRSSSTSRQGSKRGREECRDDASRRYMPSSRLDDDRASIRSHSTRRRHHSTTRSPDDDRRRHSHRSPDRARRSHRDASPYSSRRDTTSIRSSTFAEDDRYHRVPQSDRGNAPSLKRAASTRSRRHASPGGRDRRRSHRDPSPDRYSRQRRGSYYPESFEGSPRGSFESGSSSPRSRHGSQGQTYEEYARESGRSERRR